MPAWTRGNMLNLVQSPQILIEKLHFQSHFFLHPLETRATVSNAGFKQREGQRIETESAFVNFAQLAHRGREKRKEVSIC